MDVPLADGAPGGSMAVGESNVSALLARGAEAGSGGAGLLGGAEKLLARRSKESSPAVGATVKGLGPRADTYGYDGHPLIPSNTSG